MAKKNDSEVVIGGKVIILSGYESEEYMQKVAAYINGKIAEMEKTDNYRKINSDLKNTLLKLNIADDYFKAKEWAEVMEHDMEAKDKMCIRDRYNVTGGFTGNCDSSHFLHYYKIVTE